MNIKDFVININKHNDLKLIDVIFEDKNNPCEDYIIVESPNINIQFKINISECINKYTWEEIEDVLTGKRDEKVLKHISRVVGYYSNIDGWNDSKLGELKDRQKGNYKI